ncbi:MAG: hypothetical protein AAF483_14270, partial [Planctomycetota bacterium]
DNSTWVYVYLPIWILGVIGGILEAFDTKRMSGNGLANICIALVILCMVFGPGLLFGAVWMYQSVLGAQAA